MEIGVLSIYGTDYFEAEARTNKPQTNPWFNSFLAGMIRRRNCLFRCACRSNSEEMWVRYRESRNMVLSAIRSTKRRYYMHKAVLLMKLDCPSATWWKAAKELTGQTVDVKGVPPLQDTKGAFVYDEKVKAALLNGMFINQCATVSEPMPPFGSTVTNTSFNFQSVHMSDITKIIERLPDKHSMLRTWWDLLHHAEVVIVRNCGNLGEVV